MSDGRADRNLLFGILALQMDFIARDALIGAMNAWVLDKARSLGDILRWQLDRIRNHLPPAARVPTPQTTADLDFIQRNAVSGAEMSPAVTWIGHATMLVQASGLNVLTAASTASSRSWTPTPAGWGPTWWCSPTR